MKVLMPWPVSTNRYWRNFRGITVKSKEATAYCTECAWLYRAAGGRPLAGPVEFSLVLHPKLTRRGEASKIRLDLDNALKVVIDSLNRVAYEDDNQIEKITAQLGNPVEGGGVTVEVKPIEIE